jgi:hypothetical protein
VAPATQSRTSPDVDTTGPSKRKKKAKQPFSFPELLIDQTLVILVSHGRCSLPTSLMAQRKTIQIIDSTISSKDMYKSKKEKLMNFSDNIFKYST